MYTYSVLAVPSRGPLRDQSAEKGAPIALAAYLCERSTMNLSDSEIAAGKRRIWMHARQDTCAKLCLLKNAFPVILELFGP